MAKNEHQTSIFDDEELLRSTIENLQLLQNKITVDATSLTEQERQFLYGVAAASDFKEPPVQPERLVGKKISPFSRMVMSAAETFTKAKKSFNIWREKEPALPKQEAPKTTLAEYFNNRFSPVAAKMSASVEDLNSSFKSKIEAVNDGVIGAKASVVDGVSSVKASVNDGIEKVADRFSLAMENTKKIIERKQLSINERFFEIYDDVTVSRMKLQTSVESKIEGIKSTIKSVQGSVAAFVSNFEEPWIVIKGQDRIPSLEQISYNAGLYAGKAKAKLSNSLDSFFAKIEQKANAKENEIAEVFISMQNIEKPEPHPPVNEVSIGNKVEAAPEDLVKQIAENEAKKKAEAEAAEKKAQQEAKKKAEEEANKLIEAQKEAKKQDDEEEARKAAEAKALAEQQTQQEAVNANVSGVGNSDSVSKPKEKFFKKVVGLFAPKKKLAPQNLLQTPYSIDTSVKNIILPYFERKENGALPELREIFKETEKRIWENVGIRAHSNGGYDLRKSWFNDKGEVVSHNERIVNISEKTIPAYVKELKIAVDYLYNVNQKIKNDPLIIAFESLTDKVGDSVAAKNLLEQAKVSNVALDKLKKYKIPNCDMLLEDIDVSLFTVSDSVHHLKCAKFNVAVLSSVGEAIKTELSLMSPEHPEAKGIIADLNNTPIIGYSNVAKVLHNALHADYSETLNTPGNEELKLRGNASKITNITKYNEKKQAVAMESARMKEEKINPPEFNMPGHEQEKGKAPRRFLTDTSKENINTGEFGFEGRRTETKVNTGEFGFEGRGPELINGLPNAIPNNQVPEQPFNTPTPSVNRNNGGHTAFQLANRVQSMASSYSPGGFDAYNAIMAVPQGYHAMMDNNSIYAMNTAINQRAIAADTMNGLAPVMPAVVYSYKPNVQAAQPVVHAPLVHGFTETIAPKQPAIGPSPIPPKSMVSELVKGNNSEVGSLGLTKPTGELRGEFLETDIPAPKTPGVRSTTEFHAADISEPENKQTKRVGRSFGM